MRIALAFIVIFLTPPARADDLRDFERSTQLVWAQGRSALSAIERDSPKDTGMAVDGMRTHWTMVTERFGKARPSAIADSARYTELMLGISGRLVGASLMIMMGKPEAVRTSLLAVCDDLGALRTLAKPALAEWRCP